VQETSLAEVLRRAGERELAAHPELEQANTRWELPPPRALGIKRAVAVEDWRLLANEPELPKSTEQ
jgi:hypothetical protein